MRPIHFLLGFVVVLASGASAYVATRLAASSETAQPEPVLPTTPGLPNESAALRARAADDKLAMLDARLDAMTAELDSLRDSARREPAVVPAAQNIAAVTNLSVTPEQRQTVLAVMAEERAREAAEAEAKRLQGEKENAQRRAARVAKDLNLAPGDETRLADMMFESGKKRQDIMESMRNGSFDRDTMRTQMETFRTWQTDQLTVAFGASIAEQILQTEGGDRLGFGGGPGGQGGVGGRLDGGNNGGAGRAQRRANAAGGAAGAGGGGQQN